MTEHIQQPFVPVGGVVGESFSVTLFMHEGYESLHDVNKTAYAVKPLGDGMWTKRAHVHSAFSGPIIAVVQHSNWGREQ